MRSRGIVVVGADVATGVSAVTASLWQIPFASQIGRAHV